MGSQRKDRVDVHLSNRSCHLTSTLLFCTLLLPVFTVGSLLCNFCPLQYKSKSCTNVTSECLPHQRCSSSRGRYGSLHILSSQGCLDANLCDSHEMVSYRGVEYNVSHSCCCRDGCNIAPRSNTSLMELLGILRKNPDYVTNVLEDFHDSCVNYTAAPAAITVL